MVLQPGLETEADFDIGQLDALSGSLWKSQKQVQEGQARARMAPQCSFSPSGTSAFLFKNRVLQQMFFYMLFTLPLKRLIRPLGAL